MSNNNRDKFFSIACIDYRYDALVADFYAAINEKPNYYLGTAAGAALPIGIKGYEYKYGGCVTEDGKMFKSWLKDVREVYEVGTCEYRAHAQEITPGQPIVSFTDVEIKPTMKSKTINKKRKGHEEWSELFDVAYDNCRQ